MDEKDFFILFILVVVVFVISKLQENCCGSSKTGGGVVTYTKEEKKEDSELVTLISNIYMNNSKSIFNVEPHDIDEEAKELWCENYSEYITEFEEGLAKCIEDEKCEFTVEDIEDFGLFMINSIKHVSFNEFYGELMTTCTGIIDKIREIEPSKLVFYIPEKLTKSSFWVFMLCWPEFYFYIQDYGLGDKFMLCDKVSEFDEESCVVMFDDMSYSGTQLLEDFKSVQAERVFVVVPFVSTVAKLKFNTHLNIDASVSQSVIVDTISDQIKTEAHRNIFEYITKKCDERNENSLLQRLLLTCFNMAANHSLVYFDHKVADSLSIPTNFIIFGKIPGYQCRTLVENCKIHCDNLANTSNSILAVYNSLTEKYGLTKDSNLDNLVQEYNKDKTSDQPFCNRNFETCISHIVNNLEETKDTSQIEDMIENFEASSLWEAVLFECPLPIYKMNEQSQPSIYVDNKDQYYKSIEEMLIQ